MMKNNNQNISKMKTLIIAGTMKGGTTALYDFITTHSKVLPGSKKEIHYFSLYNHLGEEWYLDHFDKTIEDKEYIIDASPTYFDLVSSNIIPNQIKKFDKDAKVIIITRDPVSRAVSHLRHLQKVNKINDLVDLSPNEFFAHDFSKSITRTSNIDYHLNQVLFFSAYYRKSLIYRNEFPKDQLLFLSNDELKERPEETMEKVFSFMGLKYENNEIFHEIRHSNKSDIDDLDEAIYEKLANLLYPDYDTFARDLILYFMKIYFPDDEDLVIPRKPLQLETREKVLKSIFTGANYDENYRILTQKVRSLKENIPPLVNAYMNLSGSMKVFGTSINPAFGNVEETAIIITIADIYDYKKDRHISTYSKDN